MIRDIFVPNQFINALTLGGWQQESMIDYGALIQSIIGTNTLFNGLQCIPAAPANLTVFLEPGFIFQQEQVDSTTYGDVPVNNNLIMKFAYNLENYGPISFTPPTTPGFSRNDLIEFQLSTADSTPATIPEWNGTGSVTVSTPGGGTANIIQPNNPISASQSLFRSDSITVTVKAGTAAATGTQATPTPDAGYIGGFVVTTTQGQTQIISGNIAIYNPGTGNGDYGSSAILETLTEKISQQTADNRYTRPSQIQAGTILLVGATGTNTYTGTVTPALTAYTNGMQLLVNFSNPNTGDSDLAISGLAAKSILNKNGNQVTPGQLNGATSLTYDAGANAWIVLNSTIDDFANSLNSSGYQKLPNGLIEQWGVNTVTHGPSGLVVTLPIAFPNAALNLITSCGFSADGPSGGTIVNESSIHIYNSDSVNDSPVFWRVLGH